MKAFVVDPELLLDPWAIEDPSRCPDTEVQAEVEVTVTGVETWPTTWTIALFNGEVRWQGQTALPPTEVVVDAVQAALQANHDRVADEVEGAWFTITKGSAVSFNYSIGSNEPSRSTNIDRGSATLVP